MKKLMLALVCGTFAAMSFGATLYVSSTATGGGDGSEASPYTLVEGIKSARAGDTVQLADGVYTAETKTGNQDPYNVYDYDNVSVVGNVEHPENVVLDAHGNGVRFLGLKKTMTVRGITFRNQYGTTDSYTAIWGSGGTLNIDHCVFSGITNNSNGAAICLKTSGGGTIEDCQFIDCASTGGSGVTSTDNTAVKVVFRRCSFVRCTAVNGGAMHQLAKCVEACTFEDCSSKSSGTGGGAIWKCATGAGLTNCTFRNCTAPGRSGGAIYLYAEASLDGCLEFTHF